MDNHLMLSFYGESGPELDRSDFVRAGTGEHLVARRGKTSGAFYDGGTFQWSPAVRALCVLMLRTAAAAWRGDARIVCLSGGAHSPAASLDYALGKQPAWLIDMFGVAGAGCANARRIIRRTNPERRRPGPVVLAVHPGVLPGRAIEILLEEQRVVEPDLLEQMAVRILAPALADYGMPAVFAAAGRIAALESLAREGDG